MVSEVYANDGSVITKLGNLEHDTVRGIYNSLVKVDSDTVVLAYAGPGYDGYISTFNISSDGSTITKVTSLEHDTTHGFYNSLVKVDSDTYALAYTGGSNRGYISTFNISSDGSTITKVATLKHDIYIAKHNSLVQVDSDTFALAYAGLNDDGYISTFNISSDGSTITKLGNLEHDTTRGTYNSLVKVDSDTVALAYTNIHGHVSKFNISADGGTITEIGTSNSFTYSISSNPISMTLIDSNTLVVTYHKDGGRIAPITIYSSGFGTTVGSIHDSDGGMYNSLIQIDSDTYALAYTHTYPNGYDGHISTFSISSSGTSTEISSLEHDTTRGTYNSLVKVDSDTYALAYAGSGDDGYISTFRISGSPSQVGTVDTTAENGQVALSWSAPNNGGSAITDYIIQYSTDNSSYTTFSDGTSTSTSATVTGLTNGQQYYFKVAAVNSVGTGSYSSAVTTTPKTTSSQVGTVDTTAGNGQVALSWSAPNNGGSAITDYIIQYSTDNSSYTTFSDGTSTSTSATVTGLTNGQQYYFKVASVNSVGTGSYSTSVTTTPKTTPSQVGTVSTGTGNTQVTLSWSAPNNGGSAITDYVIQYSTDNSAWSTFADGTSASTSATVTSLTNGQQYYFRVAAVNSVGTGSYSSSVSTTPNPASPTNIVATDAETDGANGFTELNGAWFSDTFTIGSSTYAIVTSLYDDGIQIINVSDPTNIVATDAETDGANGFTELDGARGVDTFTIGSSTYAIVASLYDDGIQIINVSDPTNIVATDAETDGANGFTELDGARGVDTFTIGSSTYAIVTSLDDDGIQIIDISDPTNISAMDAETDGANGFTELDGALGVDTFTIGSSTYAIVTSKIDDGIQVINVSDPTNIVATDAETDGTNGFTELDGALGVDTFVVNSSTYAIVTSDADDGIQVINVSDPTNIVATDAETDGANGFTSINNPVGVDTFTIGFSTYAIVTGYIDSSVQIINVSDPTNIVATDAETDGANGFTELSRPAGATTFTIDSSTYAIVASLHDDGVQIIQLSTASAPDVVGTVTATPGTTSTALSWSAPSNGGSTITDYIIQYSTDNSTWSTFADGTSTSTSSTVTGLTKGATYYFKVAAVNDVGTGSYSSSASGTSNHFDANHKFSEKKIFDTGTRFQSGTEFKANQEFSGAMNFGANQVFDEGTKFAANQQFDSAQTFGNDQEFGTSTRFDASNTWGEKVDFSAGTHTFNAAQTFGAGAKFGSSQDFTSGGHDHDFSATMMKFGSGSTFAANEILGAGADLTAGTQTFGDAMTFDDCTRFADSQEFSAAMTFDKNQHFGDSTDFTAIAQTFKEGTAFGAGSTFKSDGTQSLPVGTIPSFGVLLEDVTCMTSDCKPTDMTKFLAPGGLLPPGTDPAASYAAITSDNKSFSVDGLGLTMTFDTVSGDGTIKTDLYEPTAIPASTSVGDGKVSLTSNTGTEMQTVGSVIDLSAGTATISGDISITLPYEEANIPAGTAESDLKVLHYVNDAWVTEENCTVDTENNQITCTVTSLSPFGIGGAVSSGGSGANGGSKYVVPQWYNSLHNNEFDFNVNGEKINTGADVEVVNDNTPVVSGHVGGLYMAEFVLPEVADDEIEYFEVCLFEPRRNINYCNENRNPSIIWNHGEVSVNDYSDKQVFDQNYPPTIEYDEENNSFLFTYMYTQPLEKTVMKLSISEGLGSGTMHKQYYKLNVLDYSADVQETEPEVQQDTPIEPEIKEDTVPKVELVPEETVEEVTPVNESILSIPDESVIDPVDDTIVIDEPRIVGNNDESLAADIVPTESLTPEPVLDEPEPVVLSELKSEMYDPEPPELEPPEPSVFPDWLNKILSWAIFGI